MLQVCYLMMQVPNENNMLSLYDGVPNIFQSSTVYYVQISFIYYSFHIGHTAG
jgi:hypothetical protein